MFNDQQKHGNLIFDEISLRTSISVNCTTLTYNGLEDFGHDMPSEHYGQKADHALIFMFQSYAANFSQPIAVFTSKGPVKGIFIQKLTTFKVLYIIYITVNYVIFLRLYTSSACH